MADRRNTSYRSGTAQTNTPTAISPYTPGRTRAAGFGGMVTDAYGNLVPANYAALYGAAPNYQLPIANVIAQPQVEASRSESKSPFNASYGWGGDADSTPGNVNGPNTPFSLEALTSVPFGPLGVISLVMNHMAAVNANDNDTGVTNGPATGAVAPSNSVATVSPVAPPDPPSVVGEVDAANNANNSVAVADNSTAVDSGAANSADGTTAPTSDNSTAVDSGAANSADGTTSADGGAGAGAGAGGCHITKATMNGMGMDDQAVEQSEPLNVLRWFRDNVMSATPQGKMLVNQYYMMAPDVVEAVDSRPDAQEVYRHIFGQFIAPAVEAVKSGNIEEALRIYSEGINYSAELGAEAAMANGEFMDEFGSAGAQVANDPQMAQAAVGQQPGGMQPMQSGMSQGMGDPDIAQSMAGSPVIGRIVAR